MVAAATTEPPSIALSVVLTAAIRFELVSCLRQPAISMFIVKRKRGSSARSSKSSLSQQHESDGSSHNSNPCSLATGSVKLKSILRKERIDDETPSKSSSGNQSNSQYYCKRVGFKHIHVREFERCVTMVRMLRAPIRADFRQCNITISHHANCPSESLETIPAAAAEHPLRKFPGVLHGWQSSPHSLSQTWAEPLYCNVSASVGRTIMIEPC